MCDLNQFPQTFIEIKEDSIHSSGYCVSNVRHFSCTVLEMVNWAKFYIM